MNEDPTSAIFLAADNKIAKEVGIEEFGERYFQFDVVPAGPGENLGGSLDLTNQLGRFHELIHIPGALQDWYMLGEGTRMLLTAASRFGK